MMLTHFAAQCYNRANVGIGDRGLGIGAWVLISPLPGKKALIFYNNYFMMSYSTSPDVLYDIIGG
jgi:hypothetical protein